MRIGIAGYGTGGHHFHLPFIEAVPAFDVVGVVTRSPERRAQLAAVAPGTPAVDSLNDLLQLGLDAVVLTTPPETRRELALQAIGAGVAVVADKPFAPDAASARELADAAAAARVPLTVYQNRRWDADVQTLAKLIRDDALGQLQRVHNRFDLDDPGTLEVGPAHGLLRDLGSHLVDQNIWLLGRVKRVTAHLDWTVIDRQQVDCAFVLLLHHESGALSEASSTKLNRFAERELRAYGIDGAYVARGTDVQAAALFAGRRPAADPYGWGREEPDRWGVLHTAHGSEPVRSEQGDYGVFYRRLAAGLAHGGRLPVDVEEAIHTLAVLDAARESAATGRTVEVLAV